MAGERTARIQADLRETVADLSGYPPEELDVNATFLELGFDSLFLTQLGTAFQKQFGVKITFRQLFDELPSIAVLSEHIDGELPDDALAPETSPTAPADAPAAAPPPAPTASAALPTPLALPRDAGGMRAVFARQLEIMQEQIQMLSSGAIPASTGLSAPSSTTDVEQPQAEPGRETPPPPQKTEFVSGFGPHGTGVTPSHLTKQQQAHLDALIAHYTARTATSKASTQTHRQVHADPRTAAGFNRLWKEMVYPIVVERSEGCKLWDIDGNEYVDLLNGFGPNFFGHTPSFVVEALEKKIKEGFEIGPQTPLAGETAEMICRLTGMDRASFMCTGSEAVQAAMRVARTVTGRDRVVLFDGDYHGNFDEVLVRAANRGKTLRTFPHAPGIPMSSVQEVIVLEYGAEESLDVIREQADDIAIVMVEPIQSRRPELQPREFLHALRDLTAEKGIVLHFDEVITGFRTCPGGAQEYFDVRADLATYGKVIAGGMPIGVLAGRSVFMDTLDGGMWQYGDNSFPEAGVTFFAGTFVRHPLTIVAAHACLTYLIEQGPSLQARVNAMTERFTTAVNELFQRNNIQIEVPHFASQMFIRNKEKDELATLFWFHLKARGVYLLEGFPCYLTAAHTDADVDFLIQAFTESVEAMKAGGIFPDIPAGLVQPGYEVVPTTEAQREIWTALQMTGTSRAYNESVMVTLTGHLHLDALQKATQVAVGRHEALRSTFSEDGRWLCVEPEFRIEMAVTDISAEKNCEARLADIGTNEVETPFDLGQGPLVRAQVVKTAALEHRLILTAHHIICDGWSVDILVREVGQLYTLIAEGKPGVLPPADSFMDYARWEAQRIGSEEQSGDADYWVSQFADTVPVLDLPTDRPRPTEKSSNGAREDLRLGRELADGIRRTCTRCGATLVNFMLAAFKTYIYRLTGQEDLVVGLPASGQWSLGHEGLVGHCVNLLPLRTRIAGDQPFAEYCKIVQQVMLDAYEHQHYTLGALVRELQLPRDPARVPLAPVVFNSENGIDIEAIHFKDLEFHFISFPRRYEHFEWFLNVVDEHGELSMEWSYNRDLFDRATIQRHMQGFIRLLQSVVADPDQTLSGIPLLDDEGRAVVRKWGRCLTPYERDLSVGAVFRAQAQRTPDAIALREGETTMTYGELDKKTDHLAQRLVESGVETGDRVGVCLERSVDMLMAFLAILKASGVYVPLDAEYPAERLALMVTDTDMRLALVRDPSALDLPQDLTVLAWADFASAADSSAGATFEIQAGGEDPCYVMYTSGSTGTPKGVLVPHRGVVRLVRNMNYMSLNGETCMLHMAPVTFDASTLELWGPLLNGGTVVMLPAATPSLGDIGAAIREGGVNAIFMTSELFRAMVDERLEDLDGIRQLLAGGDVLSAAHVRRVMERFRSCQVIHCYGPTENTTFTTCTRVTEEEAAGNVLPIGRPVANTTVYILDEQLQPVPVGVPGELWTGGDGVALEYINRPEQTAEVFVPDPFSEEDGARMYRTGDRACWRPDGQIAFLGRVDRQVKIRGYRVEPGEVEVVLDASELVAQAAVTAPEVRPGEHALAAYYVPADGRPVNATALRKVLRGKLPEYMVPQYFTEMDAMPVTPNGKLDRAALPAVGLGIEATDRIAPRTPAESLVAEVWGELLDRTDFDVRDNFFNVGGHSLLGLRVVARLEEKTGVRLAPHSLLFDTLEQLAARCEQAATQNESTPKKGGLLGWLSKKRG